MVTGYVKRACVIVLTLLIAAGFVRGNDELVLCVGHSGHAAIELAHADDCQTSSVPREQRHQEEECINGAGTDSHQSCVDFPFPPGAFVSRNIASGTAKLIAYDLAGVCRGYDRECCLDAHAPALDSPPRTNSLPILRSVVLLT